MRASAISGIINGYRLRETGLDLSTTVRLLVWTEKWDVRHHKAQTSNICCLCGELGGEDIKGVVS